MKEQHLPKILIVDDSPVNIQIMAKILGQDYELSFAYNGHDAVSLTNAEQPDLILLDIMMPEMNGFEVCKILQDNRTTRDIPVIFITALSMEEDETKGLELGAVDYITKPFRPAVVKARVKNQLTLKKYRDHLENISMMDGLTGIPNRRRFDEYLNQEWKRAQRVQHPISLLMLDIDHFKLYNDNYGHSAGDECLKKISRTIQGTLTRPADLAARFGGEEFACVLPETDHDGAVTIAARIHSNLAGMSIPHEYSPISSLVTISIGSTTTVPSTSFSVEQFIKYTDEMLYQAKKTGRNRTRSRTI